MHVVTMVHSTLRPIVLCFLAALLVMPAAGMTHAQDSTQSIDVQIHVVPGPVSGAGTGQDGQPSRPPGAISAVLFGAGSTFGRHGSDATAFDLVVFDGRTTAPGWRVTIHDVDGGEHGTSPVLARYLTRAEHLAGMPLQGPDGPRGLRLSIGQPLERSTSVMLAEPGTGAGVYRVRFAVADEALPPDQRVLVVAVDAAP